MEKFQKYCLSFLIVILYTNAAAQVSGSILESGNCNSTCKVSKREERQGGDLMQKKLGRAVELSPNLAFANTRSFSGLKEISGYFTSAAIKASYFRPLAGENKTFDIVGKASLKLEYYRSFGHYQLGNISFEFRKYDIALENFEKQCRAYPFAENIYFKSKVSKIRNKDYLDLNEMT
ncbi:hypothetical protein M2347_001184 [Chryseobacterium sp. H1D6B]|uniref:hypothetical protein n=1 Tax=Chryseobacterium sp. H1D6B TaxID=2940588 RepID=UPI0015C87746|nr:hypothetical protein [Chryseobacterium sp. H1D6B]MDH6251457.1 hypothetical protein [Chryseobacterium sp. H1D6B]